MKNNLIHAKTLNSTGMETLLAIIYEPKKAESFIGYVANLARDLHTNINILYVQEPVDYTLGQPPASSYALSAEAQKRNEEEAIKILTGFADNINARMEGALSVVCSTAIGEASTVVNAFVENKKAAMVILEGQEDKSFWSQPDINSKIINYAECPVWIIPCEADYRLFRKIVFVTDYKEADVAVLKNLVSFTFRLSPSIIALHITESVDFEEKIKKTGYSDIIHSKTGYQNISVKTMIEKKGENLAQLINDYAQDFRADLIVMLKENKPFFERIFSADSTKKVLKEAQMPVLIYK
jgi:nucleotide-binding universal stress UspA family protein